MGDSNDEVIVTGFVTAVQVRQDAGDRWGVVTVRQKTYGDNDRDRDFVVSFESGTRLLQRLSDGERLEVALVVRPETSDLPARIAEALLQDARGRRGWRQEWDGFHKEVQEEIRAKWETLVRDVLAGAKP